MKYLHRAVKTTKTDNKMMAVRGYEEEYGKLMFIDGYFRLNQLIRARQGNTFWQ